MANLKNITDVPVVESAEGLNLIVNDNGAAKQIAASAVGAQADWNVTDESNPAFIKNKPEVVQADWAVEDETNPSFIKNKPIIGFVMKPTMEELSVDGTTCTCTANYDELAKALETGKSATIIIPAAFTGEVACAVTVLCWTYVDGVIICSGFMGNTYGEFIMTNGTYVPTLE